MKAKLRHSPECRLGAMGGSFQDRSKTSSCRLSSHSLIEIHCGTRKRLSRSDGTSRVEAGGQFATQRAAYSELDARNYIRLSSVFRETAASFLVFISHLMPLFTCLRQ
jgi:hypothetical protein